MGGAPGLGQELDDHGVAEFWLVGQEAVPGVGDDRELRVGKRSVHDAYVV